MADLSITATSVVPVAGAVINKDYVAGETITAGQSLYLKSSDNKLYKAQSDGTASEEVFVGIALNGGAAGQPIAMVTAGPVTIGATVAVGGIYAVSATAGGIAPYADLTTGDYVSLIGYATTTAILVVSRVLTGVEKP